ncbi:MAG: flavin reductase [Clostridiales bacterium]|nr:flavin reductase [Clostridiales bacterium]
MDNRALYKISYGLYILSVKEGDKDNGCITNTVVQVTDSPKRISVCLSKQNYTTEMLLRTKEFNVTMLTVDTPFSVFKQFGYKSGRDVDKFDCPNPSRSENGIIYASKYGNSYISAKVYQTVDVGAHIMFLADVVGAKVLSDAPSVTYEYYFQHIKPKPKETDIKKGYRCKICGYIYEGEPLPDDFICPICKHGVDAFEKL